MFDREHLTIKEDFRT